MKGKCREDAGLAVNWEWCGSWALETHRSDLLSQSHCSPGKAFMLSETQCPWLQMRVIVLPCSPEGDVGGSCEWGHHSRTIRETLEGSG